MFILTYATNRMKRSIMGCAALAMLSLAFVLFLCVLHNTIIQKEQQLDDVYNNLEVECVVSNLRGTQTDNLYIKDYIVSLFLSDEYYYQGKKQKIPFSSSVKDVRLKLSLKYEPLAEKDEVYIIDIRNASNLIGLTHLSTDSTLTPENSIGITYFGNYSEKLFLTNKPVCIVSSELYQTLPKDEKGTGYLRLAVGDSAQNKELYAEQFLQVVGIYDGGGNNIYCPWEIIKELSIKLTGMIQADSLSCIVNNNRQIDTFKELLARYFTCVDNTGALTAFTASDVLISYEYAITVYDGNFNKTVSKIIDNIKTLKILQPFIIVIALGVGFLASILFVRNRKQEFAIMRSLGTKKGMVFSEALFEQLFLGLVGTALGLIAYFLWNEFKIMPPWGILGVYLLCYLTGSSFAVYRITQVKVMSILREKE